MFKCFKDSTDGESLVSSGREFQMRVVEGRMRCSIVGILRGLSEGSSRYANYIDLYYQQLVIQARRGMQVPKNSVHRVLVSRYLKKMCG